MIGPAKIYFIIFGLLTIIGGVIGFVKAGSTASIIAGSISGILLFVAAFLLPQNLAAGFILWGVFFVSLAGRVAPPVFHEGPAVAGRVLSGLWGTARDRYG